MSQRTTIDVRLTSGEMDAVDILVKRIQQEIPALTIDEVIDTIFRAGLQRLCAAADSNRSAA